MITIQIWKKHLTAFILRLLGLAISLSFLMLILSYLITETSYDEYISNKNNIFRVVQTNESQSWSSALTPFSLKSLIKNSVPDVNTAFRYRRLSDIFIRNTEEFIPENHFYCADNDLFKNLDIKLIRGDFKNTSNPYWVAISQKTAQKYFQEINPIGRVLRLQKGGNEIQAIVVAEYTNIPVNSTFSAEIIGNFKIEFDLDNQEFDKTPFDKTINQNFFTTYLVLNKNSDPTEVENKINKLVRSAVFETEYTFQLQKLSDIYFHSDGLINNFLPMGSLQNVYLFGLLGLIILLIATSNFIIITAAVHGQRKREYSIRRINGATKFNLITLICSEIFILIFTAMLLSWILSNLLVPYMEEIFQKSISISGHDFITPIILSIGVLLLIGLIAVTIVSFYLVRNETGQSNQIVHENKLPFFRMNKLLVLGQIAIFSTLIVISSIMLNQWNFLKNRDILGFNPENILVMLLPKELRHDPGTLIHDIESNPKILNISVATCLPLYGPVYNYTRVFKNEDYSKPISMLMLYADESYFKTLDINIIDGRTFNLSGDYDKTNAIILNAAAVKFLELDNPVGKKFMWKEIIGIVSDFQIETMYDEIAPLIIYPMDKSAICLALKYQGNKEDISKFIESKQLELVPLSNFSLLDYTSIIDDTYKHEKRMKSIFLTFTFIAISLGIFGIVGLLIFTLQKKSKEIMIRTIHGAGFITITTLISKEFLLGLLIANTITYPLIWYYATVWLSHFAYHLQINILYFLLGTATTVLIILILVSISVFNYLNQNPAKYLNRV